VQLVGSPAEVAASSAATIVMVTDEPAVRAVLFGHDGWLAGAGDGTLVIQSSTIGPDATRDIARSCTGRGARFIDAPVSGSVGPARDGTLTVLAGGEDADLADAAPLLDAVAKTVVHCGGVGTGSAVKLAVNATLITAMAGAAEALTWLVEAEPDLAVDTVAPVFERISPLVARRAGALVGEPAEGGFSLKHVVKDMDLVVGAMAPAVVLEAVRAAAGAAVDSGLADRDVAALGDAARRARVSGIR
jgi:3-hydroxyisobutyrate dehydrogenase